MSTNSTISLQHHNGSVRSIYCHWDGYPEHVGKILVENYDTIDKINALLDLGSLSSLGESTEKPEGHTFDHPVKGYCVAYGRDRGEEDEEAQNFTSLDEMLDYNPEQYNYVFKDQWYVVYDVSVDEETGDRSSVIEKVVDVLNRSEG